MRSGTDRETVLIADDHGLYRMGLAFLLKDQLGFERVIEVSSFDEALEQLETDTSISLALLDLSMPGMAGTGSLQEVRNCYPDIQVAVVSASERRQDVLETLAVGAHGYVPKSLSDDGITEALESILSGSVYAPKLLTTTDDGAAQSGAAEGLSDIDLKAAMARLTPRQNDVLQLIVQGKSNKEIARALEIAEGTVKIHLTALLRHLGARNRTQAVAIASKMID